MYWGLGRLERLGMALSDVVIGTNETFRTLAISRGRKRPEDVFVVRNGPDPDVFRPVPPDPELRASAPYLIGDVAHMVRQEGVEDAIRALGFLARRRTHGMRFSWGTARCCRAHGHSRQTSGSPRE